MLRAKMPKAVPSLGALQAAGARHIVDDDRRLAGNVLAHVLSQKTAVDVVAAAGAVADDHGDRLAFVEIFHRIGARLAREGSRDQQCRHRPPHQHFFPPDCAAWFPAA
jgi:hypothetical protein